MAFTPTYDLLRWQSARLFEAILSKEFCVFLTHFLHRRIYIVFTLFYCLILKEEEWELATANTKTDGKNGRSGSRSRSVVASTPRVRLAAPESSKSARKTAKVRASNEPTDRVKPPTADPTRATPRMYAIVRGMLGLSPLQPFSSLHCSLQTHM